MKILNAFSLNMLRETRLNIIRKELDVEEVKNCFLTSNIITNDYCYDVESCIGHADTATIISRQIGLDIDYNRVSVALQVNEKFILAQYTGDRLPEGTTELPDGSKIVYYACTVVDIDKRHTAYKRLLDVMVNGDGCIETAHHCITGERKEFTEDELLNMYE